MKKLIFVIILSSMVNTAYAERVDVIAEYLPYKYAFTHFIGYDIGCNSEHTFTTNIMPEVKVDEEKKARLALEKAEDEKNNMLIAEKEKQRKVDLEVWKKENPGEKLYNCPRELIYSPIKFISKILYESPVTTYIDCPICGEKMYIKIKK